MHSLDIENPDPETVKVVGRHLVDADDSDDSESKFASLRLQGGDVTRQIYNWQREHEGNSGSIKRGRSRSFDIPREPATGPHGEALDKKQMLVPGGFRRDFVTHKSITQALEEGDGSRESIPQPTMIARNFIEFLSLYGHFAGEELEDEEGDESLESYTGAPSERTALLQQRPRMTRRLSEQAKGQASVPETVMLLLKSFVGTGVLFLPRAFYNGGILFSSIVLVVVSVVSYWCFLLLIDAKSFTQVASFGDIGGALFGPRFRNLILASIVMSQLGFAAAYTVFVSENLQAVIKSFSETGEVVSVQALIVLQLIIFLPLSMIRDIAKLGFTALVADFFILLGLLYLYGWGTTTVLTQGIADVALFNKSNWTLFIGTAIFTFEGIGLIIPIQESMREPKKFNGVLAAVMVGITFVFVSVGALLYAATGSKVETVILLNLPSDSSAVTTIQFLYSLAILLSTPLQLFPAIRILENGLFVRSGKFSPRVKWEKNGFRFLIVLLTGAIAYVGANDLDKFVALTGSFACVPLVYIYPPILHMETISRGHWRWWSDVVLTACGFGIMFYTTYTTFVSWVS